MNSILKLGLNLFVICAVSAGLLAGTNEITSPLIAKRSEQASNEARQAVLSDAKEFKLLDSSKYKATSDVEVVEVYEGLNGSDVAGYTIKVLPKGYGGEIELMVGIKKDGDNAVISGVNIGEMSETPGLGADQRKKLSMVNIKINQQQNLVLLKVGLQEKLKYKQYQGLPLHLKL